MIKLNEHPGVVHSAIRPTRLSRAIRRCLLMSAGVLLAEAGVLEDAQAGPSGGEVVAGQGAIARPDASTTVVDQHSSALTVNWRSFDVGANEAVRFNQPGASSAVLNRVLQGAPSEILGSIQANGKVFIMNRSGVVFGEGARVNVGGLFVTSLDIDTGDFMAGRYRFEAGDGDSPGAIVNRGLIEAASGGFVTLAGGSASNEGVIVADMGQVHLAAGRKVTLDFDGDGLIRFEVDREVLDNPQGLDDAVSNTGAIRADGGQVLLTARVARDVFARAVNNTGLVRAGRISRQGGKVTLAGFGAPVRNTGTVDASGAAGGGAIDVASDGVIEQFGVLTADAARGDGGAVRLESETDTLLGGDSETSARAGDGRGGTVEVLGERVALIDRAVVDVSGASGGGSVLVGGDYQGAGDVRNASATHVGAGASIHADAHERGDGGRVIVWADDVTRFQGEIVARGAGGGAGGFAEVSGKAHLEFRGAVDLHGGDGGAGTLLLDPADIVIQGGAGDGSMLASGGDGSNDGNATFIGAAGAAQTTASIFYDNTSPVTVFETEIEGVDANVVLQATNSITVAGTFDQDTNGEGVGAIVRLKNNRSLTLETRNAGADGVAGIDLTGAPVEFQTQGTGSITVLAGITGGDASGDAPAVTGALTALGSGSVMVAAEGAVAINGPVITRGGAVDIDAGRGVTSVAAGTITTTAVADTGAASGAVDIDVIGAGDVALSGAITTTGAPDDGTAGTASAGGQVDVTTADGAVALGAVTTSGGAGTAGGANGGAAAAVNVTAGGAGRDATLNGTLTALGGVPDGAGAVGAGATVTVAAGGALVDGNAGALDVSAAGAMLSASAGDIGAPANPPEVSLSGPLDLVLGGATSAAYVTAPADLMLGSVTTGAGANTVSVASTGGNTILLGAALTDATLAGDAFVFDAGAGGTFDGATLAVNLGAGTLSLKADTTQNLGAVTASGGVLVAPGTAGASIGLGNLALPNVGAQTYRLDDATLNALAAAGGGNLTVGDASSGTIVFDEVSFAAQSLTLVTGATINDNDDANPVAFTSTGALTLTSAGAIGGLNGAEGLNVDVGTLRVTSTAGGDVTVRDAGTAATVYDVATGGAGAVSLTQAAGDLSLTRVSTTGDATLTALTGAITDADGGATETANVSASLATFGAATGIGTGAAGVAGGDIETDVTTLVASAAAGDVVVEELDVGGDGLAIGAGDVTTVGGAVRLSVAGNVTSAAGADIVTTAAVNSGAASGAVSVAATGTGAVSLAGSIVTTGANDDGTAGTASAGGQVDVTTADGAVRVAAVTSSGGAGTAGAAGGGAAAAINVTAGGALRDVTLDGALTAFGGTPDGAGVPGSGATVTVTAGRGIEDGVAGEVLAVAAVLTAGTGGIDTADVLETAVGSLTASGATGLSIVNTGDVSARLTASGGVATLSTAGTLGTLDTWTADAFDVDATGAITVDHAVTADAGGIDLDSSAGTVALNQALAATAPGQAVRVEGQTGVTSAVAGTVTTSGGGVTLRVAGAGAASLAGGVTTTAAVNSGAASGAVDIDVIGAGDVALSGAITTTGAPDDGTAGTASAGGQVDVTTADGAVALGAVTTSGGAGTAGGANGGAAAAVNVTAGGAGRDATLNGTLTALGGAPDGAGAVGAGATVTVAAGGALVDGNAGALDVSAAGAMLSASAGDIGAPADPLEVSLSGPLDLVLGGATSAAYVTAPADLTLGSVTTGAGANTVSVASTGGNTILLGSALTDATLAGDAFVFDAGAGGTFDGATLAVNLGAGTLSLKADTTQNLGAVTASGGVLVAPGTAGASIGLGNLALANVGAQTYRLDDATLNALAAAGGGNLTVGDASSGTIVFDEVSFAAQSLTLVTGATINDNDDANPVAFTSTGALTLTSAGAIGGLNGAEGLNVDVGTLRVTSTAGGDVTVRDAGTAATVYDVATGGAGAVSLTQAAGDLSLTRVSTTGDATLTALTGAITDADGGATETANVSASLATFGAATGIGTGAAGVAGGDIETDVTTLVASTAAGDVVVEELDVGGDGLAIGAGDVTTVGGAVRLSVAGNVTSAAGADIVTTAAVNSGAASGAVSVAATGTGAVSLSGSIVTTGANDDGTAGTASAGGQVDVTTADGAVRVAAVTSSGGAGTAGAAGGGAAAAIDIVSADAGSDATHDVTLDGALTARGGAPDPGGAPGSDAVVSVTADGGVLDGNAGLVNVAAAELAVIAGAALGAAGDLLETDVTTLTADAAAGVFVSELDTASADGLAIGSGDVVTAGGDVRLLVAGDLTSVAGADIVTTAAPDSGTASGAVDLDTSGTGAVTLAGEVRTAGAANAAGTASAGGQVDVDTADAAVTLARVTTSGGDSGGGGGNGGAAGAINVTSADAGNDQAHDVTLDDALNALGGLPDGAGAVGGGATVRIVADGGIVDGLGTAAVDVAGAAADLTAGGSIGSAGNRIDLDVTTLADATVVGAGGVFLDERDTATGDGLTVTNIDALGAGNGVFVTVTGGDLRLGTVDAPALVSLEASAGDVLDDNGGATNLTAATLVVNAPGAGASIGLAGGGGAIDLDVAGGVTASAPGAGGGVFLRETDAGGLLVASIDAGTGNVALEATAGPIVDAAGDDDATDIVAGALTINGAAGVGVSDANALNLAVTDFDTAAAIGGDVFITNAASLALATVDAGANTLSIRAITGNLLDNGSALSSNALRLTASAGGIGTGGGINTTTTGGGPITLTTGAPGAAGNVSLSETNGLQTAGANAVSVATDGGTTQSVSLASAGTFTLNSDFGDAGDDFVLSAASLVDAANGAGRILARNLSMTSTTGGVGASGAGQMETTLGGTLTATAAAVGVFVEDASGSIDVAGIDGGTGNVELLSSGTIAQSGAIVNTATLDTRSGGAINLATQANDVATFTADNDGAGGVAFNNASGVALSIGSVQTGAGGGLTVTGDADIAFTGVVDADGAGARASAVAVTAAAGDVTQPGGRLITSALSVGATTNAVTLGRNNDVQSFLAPSVNGAVSLVNGNLALPVNPLALGAIGTNGNDLSIVNTNGTVSVSGAVNGGAGSAVTITTIGGGDIVGTSTVTSDDLTLIAAGAIGAGTGSPFQAAASGLLDYRAMGGDIAVANAASWRTSGLDLSAPGARTVTLSGAGGVIVDSALDGADSGLGADDRLVLNGPVSIQADVATGGIAVDLLNITSINAANIDAGGGDLSLQLAGEVTPTVPGGTLTIGDTGRTRFSGTLRMGGSALVTDGRVLVFGDSVIRTNDLTFNGDVRAGEDGASLLLTTNDPPPLDADGALEIGGTHPVFKSGNVVALNNGRPTGFGGARTGTTLSIMATKDQPDTLPGFSAPGTATNYDVKVTSPLNAGTAELTIVARGDITIEATGLLRGRQVNLNALGRQDAPASGLITDRINPGVTGSTPGTFAVQATELAVMIANDQIGSTSSAEGGRFNVNAPLFQLLKGSEEDAQVDPGLGSADSSATEVDAMFAAYATDLGAGGLYSATSFTGGTNVPTIISGLETTGLGELGFIDEGLFLLPDAYAVADPATKLPWDLDPDFPGDLRPDDPDDDLAWLEFYDILREYTEGRFELPEDERLETSAGEAATASRGERAERELADIIAYFDGLRDRERERLAAEEEALELDLDEPGESGDGAAQGRALGPSAVLGLPRPAGERWPDGGLGVDASAWRWRES